MQHLRMETDYDILIKLLQDLNLKYHVETNRRHEFLNDTVASDSKALITMMMLNSIPVPCITPMFGDSLVFTWKLEPYSFHLDMRQNIADFYSFNGKTYETIEKKKFDLNHINGVTELISHLQSKFGSIGKQDDAYRYKS